MAGLGLNLLRNSLIIRNERQLPIRTPELSLMLTLFRAFYKCGEVLFPSYLDLVLQICRSKFGAFNVRGSRHCHAHVRFADCDLVLESGPFIPKSSTVWT